MYRATFKCRLCGEVISLIGIISEEKEAYDAVMDLCLGRSSSCGGTFEHIMHMCPDGSIGYADFLGLKKESTDDQN